MVPTKLLVTAVPRTPPAPMAERRDATATGGMRHARQKVAVPRVWISGDEGEFA